MYLVPSTIKPIMLDTLRWSTMASQITGNATVCSPDTSDWGNEKPWNSPLLTLCQGIPPVTTTSDRWSPLTKGQLHSPHIGCVMRKAFQYQDFIKRDSFHPSLDTLYSPYIASKATRINTWHRQLYSANMPYITGILDTIIALACFVLPYIYIHTYIYAYMRRSASVS